MEQYSSCLLYTSHTDPAMVCQLIEALGGPDNVQSLSSCFTRLRITVADPALKRPGVGRSSTRISTVNTPK